jgi:hypothetical protein
VWNLHFFTKSFSSHFVGLLVFSAVVAEALTYYTLFGCVISHGGRGVRGVGYRIDVVSLSLLAFVDSLLLLVDIQLQKKNCCKK